MFFTYLKYLQGLGRSLGTLYKLRNWDLFIFMFFLGAFHKMMTVA